MVTPGSDCFVSVVAPLWNDADIVEEFVAETTHVLRENYANYELVLVDDGSTDDTVKVVGDLLQRYESIRLICLSRRFGGEIAIAAGFDSVIGDFIVVMQPASDPPALIPEIVERARRGAEIVYGIRKQRAPEPPLIRLGVRLYYWLVNRVLGMHLPRNASDFRVFSRRSMNAILQIKDRLRYLRTFSSYVGYATQPFEYLALQRRAKPRSRGLFESVNLAISVIVSNTTRPLRLVSWLGLLMSCLSVLYAAYVVAVYFLLRGEIVAGWATQSLQTSGMFFVLFLILAVLCEYIDRLLGETQDRPLYYILDERNSSVLIHDTDRKNVVTDSVDE